MKEHFDKIDKIAKLNDAEQILTDHINKNENNCENKIEFTSIKIKNFKINQTYSNEEMLKENSLEKSLNENLKQNSNNNSNSSVNSKNLDGDDENSVNSENEIWYENTYISDSSDKESEFDLAQYCEEYTKRTCSQQKETDSKNEQESKNEEETIENEVLIITDSEKEEQQNDTLSDTSCIILDEEPVISGDKNAQNLQTKAKTISKRAKMKKSINESIEKNNSNKDVKALTICLGARVLALKDKAKHKWQVATILRIMESGQKINSPIKASASTQNINKMIKSAIYTVIFEDDDEEDLDYGANALFYDDNYAESQDLGEDNENSIDSSSNQSDENDIIECDDSLDEKSSSSRNLNDESTINKKRKVARKTTKSGQNGRCKKRTIKNTKNNLNPSSRISADSFKDVKSSNSKKEPDVVELKSDCIAYINGYEKTVEFTTFNTKSQSIELPIKSRVVAFYSLTINSTSTCVFNCDYFCSGTIGELPCERNSFRYLIFFDNGYVSYAKPIHVYPIFDLFHVPLERLHLEHINFLFNYFSNYPERSMVVFARNNEEQTVNTYLYGKWYPARLVDIDCSIIRIEIQNKIANIINSSLKTGQMFTYSFQIYRGSYKLFPLYENFINSLIDQKNPTEKTPKQTEYERYIKAKIENKFSYENKKRYISLFSSTQFPETETRNKAVKELMSKLIVLPDNAENEQNEQPKVLQGIIKHLDLEMYFTNRIYKPHPCTRSCVGNYEVNIKMVKYVNPLLVPLLHGWQRQICTQKKTIRTGTKKWISYMAPCGRMLRNTGEVDRYLSFTDSQLTLDMFSFDCFIHIDREYEANAKNLQIDDITNGSEKVPISCVNCVDMTEPDKITYSATRKPLEGVPLNTTPEDLDGCDCTDNCRDRTKCNCWRKTFEATLFGNPNAINTDVGYRGRRLPKMVNTGIFECNSKCKCDCRCSNKVVQNGISVRIQLFKTTHKGWGLRCLDDIPKGTFICTYAGLLMTEEQSDIRGAEFGDEYFAELDFLQCLRSLMNNSDQIDDSGFNPNSNDLDENSNSSLKSSKIKNSTVSSKLSDSYQRPKLQLNSNLKKNEIAPSCSNEPGSSEYECIYLDSDEDEQDTNSRRQLTSQSFTRQEEELNNRRLLARQQKNKKTVSTIQSARFFTNKDNRFFYKDYLNSTQEAYIMDAKSWGNIGRWFNHSCSPNIFVQNVFIDTYDLKFPWIAFFSLHAIKAGTELCWDYNYTIDSVKGRVLYCFCNSANCRGRLL